MDWEARFLQTLQASRPAWDEPPVWQAALVLYQGLTPPEVHELDRTVLRMIDEEYRNPHGGLESLPLDDVMVNLPAGMTPDDLMCVEAAVLVAAARGLGEAFFALNRLMRSPRWHAMYPRLHWLSREGFDAQRQLGLTRAGRGLGALVGAAVGDAVGLNRFGFATEPRPGNPVLTPGADTLEAAIPRALAGSGSIGLGAPGFQLLLDALLDGAERDVALVFGQPEAAAAVVAFGDAASFEECLTRILDRDPAAAPLAGALAGAYFGPAGIPRRWTHEIKGRPQLEEAAEALYAAHANIR